MINNEEELARAKGQLMKFIASHQSDVAMAKKLKAEQQFIYRLAQNAKVIIALEKEIHDYEIKHLGATGKYPQDKFKDDDEGEIRVAVGIHNGRVLIDFGPKQVKWLALDKQTAIAVGNQLIKKAESLPDETNP